MRIELSGDDFPIFAIDRSGMINPLGGRGLRLTFKKANSDFCIDFENEQDAIRLAKEILVREGEWPVRDEQRRADQHAAR